MGLQGLTDKVAVVVGGATGIGAATAARLGGEGCRVVIGDIAEDAARQTAERIAAAGGTATHVAFDLADPDSVADLIAHRRNDLRAESTCCSTSVPT